MRVALQRLLDAPEIIVGRGRTVLMCARGSRSRGTAEALRARGVQDVWSLAGGLETSLAAVGAAVGADTDA